MKRRERDDGNGTTALKPEALAPKTKSKSTKCYSSSVAGGIGTVDGAARGGDALTMHGPIHASSRRLVRRTPFDSVDAVL